MPGKKDAEKPVAEPLSLRQQLLGQLADEDTTAEKREVSVMTRMSGEQVEVLDALVELDIFKSRSEAVSAFVAQAISARKSLFEEIKKQAVEIRKLRDSAKKHAFEVLKESE